jgi:hypothetical protein
MTLTITTDNLGTNGGIEIGKTLTHGDCMGAENLSFIQKMVDRQFFEISGGTVW